MTTLNQPICLMILDGWGIGEAGDPHNAIERGQTPHLSLLAEMYPSTVLGCSGEAVGLPEGQMGNSEVGHLNMGAGRVVYQELTRISKSIRDGDFYRNPVLKETMAAVRAGGALHLMGLLSDGGVHSHYTHLLALVRMAGQEGIGQVYIHAFLDGRDVPPSSGADFVAMLEKDLAGIGRGEISTVSGRYYAMDRDQRWDRSEKAYAALVRRQGRRAATAGEAVAQSYAAGETDEFVLPTVVESSSDRGIAAGDAVIFFNFRPDRARQITRAFIDESFTGFARTEGRLPIRFTTMTQYDETFSSPVAFPASYVANTLGEALGRAGLSQLRIAETEKYAHVTFFFNGGEERPFPGEERILIPSPKVATYDLQPEMSAPAVTDRLVAEIRSGRFDFIVVNFANGDMVGHTGKMEAALEAVRIVDACVGRVVAAMRDHGGITCITADHGNAEAMFDDHANEPLTAHTTNKVPFILVSERHRGTALRPGILADVAPTVLDLAGVAAPPEMTGRSLIARGDQ